MPRTARKKSATGIYHVMLRGMDRRDIFSDDADRRTFLKELDTVREISGFKLYAYCLMDNHVHLLLKEGSEPLGTVFKRIGASYVYYYNWKYQLSGHLYQDRYRSEPVETDGYFWDVLRYICQNPVKAGMCAEPFEYPWLSCAGAGCRFLKTDDISQLAGLSKKEIIRFVSIPPKSAYLDYEVRKRMTDREAQEKFKSFCGMTNAHSISDWDTEKRDRALLTALEAGVSIRQLSRLTGISKAVIERIARQ